MECAGFVRTKRFDYLAGVLLALTGSEVMYAKYVYFDTNGLTVLLTIPYSLGQFNALSIRVSLLNLYLHGYGADAF